jgi:putative tricarboxylic transport membrane protein
MREAGAIWRPEHEIEIVAGTPPGGGLDRCARALARAIEAAGLLKVPVRITNMPGEGGRGAWMLLDRRPGDAHTLVVSSINLTTDHLLGESPFEHETAFTPLAILYTEYLAFLARSNSNIGSGEALLARLAGDAASLTFALSIALGNPNHIGLAKVVRHAGGNVTAPKLRVFDSALDAVADTMAGNTDVAVVTAASAVREIASGAMRALALSAPRRAAGVYAGAPTWGELGVDCVIGSWRGVSGARGITDAQVAHWEEVLRRAAATKEWAGELERHYWTPMHLDGTALRQHLARERAELAGVLRELGLLR